MSEDNRLHHVASIHATLTALSVSVGRLEEQMKAVRDDLLHHTKSEHRAFEDALKVVQEIKASVSRLQGLEDQRTGAVWLLTKIGGVLLLIVGGVAWLLDRFFLIK